MQQHTWKDETHINWVSGARGYGYRAECTCGWKGEIENEDEREWAQDAGTQHEREMLADLYDTEEN